MTAAPPRPDPLALPPVPPPAPGRHARRDAVVVALFALALALGQAGAIVNRDRAVTAFENRAAAAWPAWPSTVADARAWPPKLEAAFADRFGGRDALIALHHWTAAVGFGVSPVANVLIGRDGWLFFRGEDGKAIDRDFRGVAPYPADEPARVAAEFKRRHDYLAALGIPYVVMVVPDKHTIYPEQLPAWVTKVVPQTRLDRVYAALAAYPEVTALDLRPALVAAKARERTYFKTDSHWNLIGATVGYDALAAALKAKLPGFPAVPVERPEYVPGVDVYRGDLATMLGLRRAFREDDIAPLARLLGHADRRCARRVTEPAATAAAASSPGPETQVWACARAGLPTALVYRDSMGIPLVPLLSENFSRVVYVSDRRLVPAQVERERPDVVIEQLVERNLHFPIAFPM